MAETKMSIYLSRNALEEVIVCDDDYPNLHHIFNNHAVICVNLTDEEFDQILLDEESELSQLLKNDVKIVPLREYFTALQENQSIIVDKPRSMFFFDITRAEAQDLSERFGVIVQSESDIDDDILQLSFKKNLDKGEVVPGQYDGWRNLLDSQKLPPSNSLIITDNYLLQNDHERKSVGIENVKLLLNAVLPAKLDTVFHILIVSQMPDKVIPQKADLLVGQLKAYLSTIRDYEFQLEYVFYKTVHPRKLISNYYVLTCDKGFKVFHPTKEATAYDENEIALSSVLHDTRHTAGDTVLAISYKVLEKLRKLCKEAQEQVIGKVNSSTKIIGDTGPKKTIRNRLMG